jgi:3',5'-cyclic AMP phosphodiesterase CpdA
MAFRVLQVSDTHVSGDRPCFNGNARAAFRHAPVVDADLVIHTGDVALDAVSRPRELAVAKGMADDCPVPVRHIPGNHDIGDNGYPGLPAKQAVTERTLAAWREVFGPDFWSMDVPGWRFVALNAQILGAGSPDEAAQLAFLRDAVAGASGRKVALWIHKPLFLDAPDVDALPLFRYAPRRERVELLRILGGADLRLVACGHAHQHVERLHDGCAHVWAPATAFVLPDAIQSRVGRKACGAVLHEFDDDGVLSTMVVPDGVEDLDITAFPEAYGRIEPIDPAPAAP